MIRKKIVVGFGLVATMLCFGGCVKTEWHDYSKETPVIINTQHNGVANAEQDIKVITFNGQVLKDCKIDKNDDGSIVVTLKIDSHTAKVEE